MIVAGRRAETLVDDVEDYDYNNQADREAFCPDIDDNNDAYGTQLEYAHGSRYWYTGTVPI